MIFFVSSIGLQNFNIDYGNIGCGVRDSFWLKINCSQRKSLDFAKWCNGEVSKNAEI